MQHAINIFGYGLTQFFTNLGAALRLTGLAWLGASLLIYGLGHVMIGLPIGPTSMRPDAEGQMPALSASFGMIGVVINLLASTYVAMIWARFCLGHETPKTPLPSLKGQPFGGALITFILVIAGVGAVAFLLSLIGSLLLPYMPFLVGLLFFPVVMAVIMLWLTLRLGAAIPASAAGEMMSLTAAWNGSRGMGLGLVAVLAFMTITIVTLPSVLLAGLIIPGNIVSVLGTWALLLIGTGWLVAIYTRCTDSAA